MLAKRATREARSESLLHRKLKILFLLVRHLDTGQPNAGYCNGTSDGDWNCYCRTCNGRNRFCNCHCTGGGHVHASAREDAPFPRGCKTIVTPV